VLYVLCCIYYVVYIMLYTLCFMHNVCIMNVVWMSWDTDERSMNVLRHRPPFTIVGAHRAKQRLSSVSHIDFPVFYNISYIWCVMCYVLCTTYVLFTLISQKSVLQASYTVNRVTRGHLKIFFRRTTCWAASEYDFSEVSPTVYKHNSSE